MEEDQDFDILPVIDFKDELMDAICNNQIIICIGETGSGKTTQIPQFCADREDILKSKAIAVTQPRRVAAMTVAHRVAEERKVELGREVGYTIRFDDKSCVDTRIKFMTDGILVRECLSDANLSKYNVIMLDEAHERSIHTDILFGLVKLACLQRSDLRVIVTSATLNVEKFSTYFNNCPIIRVPGRVFPVDIYHSKMKQTMTTSGPATNTYIQKAAEIVLRIHQEEEDGHILVFLTGQEEIEKCCGMIREQLANESEEVTSQNRHTLLVLPLYAALPAEAQKLVFSRVAKDVRKVVISTNIAETSVTVPHVRYVVDPGYVKQKVYDPERHISALVVVPISRVSAEQRAGRAGRTGPGSCYRLYSSDCMLQMTAETIPEIQRSNLSNVVLQLKALGVHDVIGFDFLDPPSEDLLAEALVHLHLLGGLDESGQLTGIGNKMTVFSVEPVLSRTLIEAASQGCLEEAATVAAMMSVEDIWVTRHAHNSRSNGRLGGSSHSQKQPWAGGTGQRDAGEDGRRDAEEAHARQRHPLGDHHTYLRVYDNWIDHGESSDWCFENFIRQRSLRVAKQIRSQLLEEARKAGLETVNHSAASSWRSKGDWGGRHTHSHGGMDKGRREERERDVRLSRSIAAGLFMNAARRCTSESIFRTLPMLTEKPDSNGCSFSGSGRSGLEDGQVRLLHLHPTCSLNSHLHTAPEMVLYQDLLSGAKPHMRHVCVADNVATEVNRYRDHWRFVPAEVLSGRLAPEETTMAPDMDEDRGVGMKRKAPAETGTRQDAVGAAKERYLARKKAVTTAITR